MHMTRTEAIAMITARLAALDDDHVMTVADIVEDMANPTEPTLDLTDAERAGIERSKEDFKAGRTYSDDRYRAEINAFMAEMQSKHR
jgi:hypothetical protein